ncbi:DivIVA domain-containing protein, partial [Candidatus Latescibacterota bacterium]
MNISPLDIRKHEFRKTIRGFDTDEVIAFLDMLSIELESFIRENALLNERVTNTDSQLKKYRDIESTLQETLLSAQRAREETINTAKKQAEIIIREAEVKAASIIEEGRNELSRMHSSFTELKIQRDTFLTKFKALINAQLEMLDQLTESEEKPVDVFLTGTDSGVSDGTYNGNSELKDTEQKSVSFENTTPQKDQK